MRRVSCCVSLAACCMLPVAPLTLPSHGVSRMLHVACGCCMLHRLTGTLHVAGRMLHIPVACFTDVSHAARLVRCVLLLHVAIIAAYWDSRRILGCTSHLASCVFHVAHRMMCLVHAAAAASTNDGALAHARGAWVSAYPITVVQTPPMTVSPTTVGKAAATSACAPPGGALRALAQTHCRIKVPHDRAWQPGSGGGVPLPPPLPSLWTDCDCCFFVCSCGPAEFRHCTSCPCQEADPNK
jgi:hypothetical protein